MTSPCSGYGITLPVAPAGKSGWPWQAPLPDMPETMPDGRPWPKISIITPNYNYGSFLEETIRSVLMQGYPNLEYIIIDGGSTDDSIKIIKKYEPWISYWESERDRGQSHAINKGFARASGDIFAWLNADDRYTEFAFRTIANVYAEQVDKGAYCGCCRFESSDGVFISERCPPGLGFSDILNWRHYLPQSSCFFRREMWGSCGPLDESLHFQMDYDLWLSFAKHSDMMALPEVLSIALIHEKAKTASGDNKADMLVERWLVLLKHAPDAARKQMTDFLRENLDKQRGCFLSGVKLRKVGSMISKRLGRR